MLKSVRVGIVDDQPLFLDGIVHVLKMQSDMELAGRAASTREALRVAQELAPDVVIVGMILPDDGFEVFEALLANYPLINVLLLSDTSDEDRICNAISRGLLGYLPKGVRGQELVEAVRALGQGVGCISPTLAPKLFLHKQASSSVAKPKGPLEALTRRERQILCMVTGGLSNRHIGERLKLSEGTVKYYVTSIMNKLKVRNRVEAALLARSEGVIHQPDNALSEFCADTESQVSAMAEYRFEHGS